MDAQVSNGLFVRLERQLESMSSRDKRLLMGLMVLLTVVFLGGTTFTLRGWLGDRAEEVAEKKEMLQQVQTLGIEYNMAMAEVSRNEVKLKAHQNKPVSAYVEEIAGNLGILDNLKSVNARGTPEVSAGVRQTMYSVEIQRTESLEALICFLHELETSGFPARVETAKFNYRQVREVSQYTLNLDLVVYSLAEG